MQPLRTLLIAFLLSSALSLRAQETPSQHSATLPHRSENLVMIALDGMRWQEIFGGIDTTLMNDPAYTKEKGTMKKTYWDADPAQRRRKLLPFFWNTIVLKGQLYGNRELGNKVDVANPYKFTYPGFSETVTGNPDSAVNSNKLVRNRNYNVLEFINSQKGYAGRVATFATSELFPYILNKWRNGLYVNADTDSLAFDTPQMQLLNDMERLAAKPTGERPDLLTYFAAREYLKKYHPKVLYIPMGETDAFAHDGLYDQYLGAAHAEDAMIADCWNILQSLPQYKDKTTLIITCDHGRGGKIKDQWRDHGVQVDDSGSIWFAVIGPDTAPTGEMTGPMQVYQGQLAATMAALLGFRYAPQQKVLPVIGSVLSH